MQISIARTATLAGALVLLAAPLLAQRGDTARVFPIDTLAVRVLRTPLPPLRAPYAVSAAGGAAERAAKPGLALDEVLSGIPGVQVDNRFNYAVGERISVRGFGARAQFGVRGVRVLVDGLPATLPDGQTTLNHVDVGSVARAEVVRGPASALYGNASGGVIRLTTQAPPPVPLAADTRVTGGADGLLRVQGSAGGTAGAWGWRAGVTRLEYDGFRRLQRAENTLGSLSAGWSRGADEVRLSATAVRYDARNPGGLTRELLAADRGQAAPPNLADRTGEEGRQGQIGVTWRRAMGGEGALEIGAHGLARSVDNPIPRRLIDLDRRAGGVRASLSGAVGTTGVRWAAGAEAEVQRDDRRNFALSQGVRGDLALDQLERVLSTSGFLQASAPLGPVEILGAVRYDRFRFRADDRLVSAENPDDSGSRTMDAWSPTLGVSVAAARGLALYANVSTAFETPTTTELANRPTGAGGFNPDLEPQRTTSYEAGMKARAGRAWIEAAAYRARVRDALIPFEVEGSPGRQFFRNAGSATHRGVEIGAGAGLFRGATARVAYTYTDARFSRYLINDTTDLSGNRVPGIAPHRVEGTLVWESPRGLFAGVDARHLSSIPVADTDAAGAFESPAYTLFDLRAGWTGIALGRLRASPRVEVANVFGAEYNASVVVNAFGGRYYEPGPGRSAYLGIDVAVGAEAR